MKSLWGEEFNIEQDEKKLLKKVKATKEISVEKQIKSKGVPLNEKLNLIRANVYKILGKYKDDTIVIDTREALTSYIDTAINNGVIAIDTETNNSLDPYTCKIMGGCIYTPGLKNAYIPINHINPTTGERLNKQLTEKDLKEEFSRLSNTKIIMHNAPFDIKVIKCTCDIELKVYWDSMIAARLLNENESARLKDQYAMKVDPSSESYSITHLFKDIEYALVDPALFALYAATDSYITYRLYKWQEQEFQKPDNQRLFKLFQEVEMPIVEVSTAMEMTGVCIDTDYAAILSKKVHSQIDEIDKKIEGELQGYASKIQQWRLTPEALKRPLKTKKVNGETVPDLDKNGNKKFGKSKDEQLKDPVEVTSPTQLAILLYDVLKVPVVDKKQPRSTGEEVLHKINLPLCKYILEKRGREKLLGTYIDKLPESISPRDGRLHAEFNQVGTDTGRFSSSNPNLQNIPSHDKTIRLMFVSSPGYVMVGSDYSQQEPRCLAHFSNDDNMINAYKEGKDLYATIAAGVYNNTYEDNLEHYSDGSINAAGAERRRSVKSLLLGIMYGRGVASIAEQINGTIKDAQQIIDNFYLGFPKVKEWMDKSQYNARTLGYVEDIWGRRRRLPDINLPRYEITQFKNNNHDFNPLLGVNSNHSSKNNPLIQKYEKALQKIKNRKEVEKLNIEAESEGVHIHNNSGFIAEAERQCVNARIQGSAATMTKKAMILAYHDKELNDLGFRLLIPVHDELIGECPKENAEKVAARLSKVMIAAPGNDFKVPMKCDAEITTRWYEHEYLSILLKNYNSLIEEGMNKETALNKIYKDNPEAVIFNLSEYLG